ncbi:putative short chain dehydrogenase/reductase [Actinacidiphila reveromycinica]|uniref:Putative short chain dehydrogenase/reductase n=1 Tax=Actinacidiphila reveromycinica TaxID=659352 RepID=A0A7U3UR80_9ACTN|nr:SDR family oxidoreductase [Streptomyces sp. SN-593]BBA97225.1 putative short chain dehydrogenase/reductase [Streptomyces sp. SN-593]
MTQQTGTRDRVALITGANRGLGRSTALRLAAEGVDSVLTYRSHADEAQAVVDEITALGRTARALPLDAGRVEDFPGFVAEVERTLKETWGRDRFDYLVNNAGHSAPAPFAETTVEDFDALFAVHVRGVYFLTQALAPLIADGGRIVNTSSGLARFSRPGMSAYAMTKGAVEVFTRYLALELGGRGITANTVAPGPIATDFGGGYLRDNEQVRTQLGAETALGRVGEPDDIGGVVASLLSEHTGWINGQRVEASGGTLL